MTQENLDRPTRRRIKRKKLKNGKRRVFIRTEWRTGHGTVYSEWLELRDDPKNGVYDLTNWNKKFHPFGGRYSSRKHYPSRYRTDETKENGKSSSSPYPHMCSFDEEEFYNFFAKHKGRYSQLVKLRIKSGELQDYLQDEALDAICDGVRVAYLKYDPKHPPKFCLERGGNVKSASLETFLEHVARHVVVVVWPWVCGIVCAVDVRLAIFGITENVRGGQCVFIVNLPVPGQECGRL